MPRAAAGARAAAWGSDADIHQLANDLIPDMERMVQWTVLTNVDHLGVHVAVHAFEAILQAFNEKRPDKPRWTVRREDASSSSDFGTMDDIPDGWFDFQTTFKAEMQKATIKDQYDSLPVRRGL
jgi:hypothetical protein